MSRVSVKDYLRRAEIVYKTAAAEVVKSFEKVTELKKEREDVNKSLLLTPQGKAQKRMELDGQIKAVENHMAELRADANKRAGEIRAEMERVFFGFYGVDPQAVDMQTVTLINAGVVSDRELLAMAKTASPTMRRLIGKALSESKNEDMARQGRYMLVTCNPHTDAMNALMGIGDYACGGAPMSGASGAAVFLSKWDELTRETFDKAPKVEMVSKRWAPGGVVFATPDNPVEDDD